MIISVNVPNSSGLYHISVEIIILYWDKYNVMCFMYLLANVMISTVIVMFSPLLLCVCVYVAGRGSGWGCHWIQSIKYLCQPPYDFLWFVFWGNPVKTRITVLRNKYTYICHEIDGMEWTFICLTDFVIPVHLCRNTKMCALFDIDLCLKQRRTKSLLFSFRELQ